jgi:hypothetical protein
VSIILHEHFAQFLQRRKRDRAAGKVSKFWHISLVVESARVAYKLSGQNFFYQFCYMQEGSSWSRPSPTGTCFIQKIYAPSSSLLQGKYLPFFPSPFRLNIFRLFVILSLTQLYCYTPEIFLFSTATFKYTYRPPSHELDKNIQRTSLGLLFSHWNGYSHFRFALDFSYAFGIL